MWTGVLLLLVCISIAIHSATSENKFERINERARQLILSQGYLVKNYTVETEDGYLLDLLRMPYYRATFSSKFATEYVGTEELSLEFATPVYKGAVLLVPALMSTFEEFVAGGAGKGLAFNLANYGYDVFLANVRGSTYGRRHVTLDADKDESYWNYSLDDIALRDLPAIIDKVLSINGENRKMRYIGHMEGSTLFYMMASEKPEYNDKMRQMIALGPVAYMNHSEHAIIKKISELVTANSSNSIEPEVVWTSDSIKEQIGATRFTPSRDITEAAEMNCSETRLYFLMNGCNSENYDENMVEQLSTSDVSVKHILQYVQIYMSGKLRKYDEHLNPQVETENGVYDLSKVTCPVEIFYTPNDAWSHTEDVEALIQDLPKVTFSRNVEQFTNNMDLLLHNGSRRIIQNTVRQLIRPTSLLP